MAIAAEWDAQTNQRTGIMPATMPLMTIASTAIDQLLPDPSSAHHTCLSYLPTDTALFWTHSEDRLLLKKQRQHFEPLLRWLKKSYNVELEAAKGGHSRIHHPEESIEKMKYFVHKMVWNPLFLVSFYSDIIIYEDHKNEWAFHTIYFSIAIMIFVYVL